MPFSTIGNFTFEPAIAAEYAFAKMVEVLTLLARGTGIIDYVNMADLRSNLGEGGQFVNMPYFQTIGSLITRRDLDATTDPGDLDITGSKEVAVLLRRKAGPVKFTEDLFTRGLRKDTVEQAIGNQIGQKAAVEIRDALFRVATAAIESVDTPSADCHINSIYAASGTKKKLTINELNNTRMKLGDAYLQLTHAVVHSDVFADLFADGIANYKVDTVAGHMIVSEVPQLCGLKIIVTDSSLLKVTNAESYMKYKTLLFGQKALAVITAQDLRIDAERRLDFEAPYWRVLGNFDFAPHLKGMTWTAAGANPIDDDLATASNWDEAYNDHREVLCAEAVTNASAA